MFYSSTEIDGDLRCAYCKEQFVDVVKFVPGCGECICGQCHEVLKAAADDFGQFKCRACDKWHSMPKDSLTDAVFIQKLLTKSKFEKPLSEKAKTLKRLIEASTIKLRELEAFDEREHVNQHCDLLEVEVAEEIESLVRHLREIETDLFKQIREYRAERLESISIGLAGTKEDSRVKTASLRRELAEFSAEWNDYFARLDAFVTENEIDHALVKQKSLETKLASCGRKLKIDALGNQIMQFKVSHSFLEEQDPLRNLLKLEIPKKVLRIRSTPLRTFSAHSAVINQVIFLSNDRLASCAYETAIKIWNISEGKQLFELNGHSGSVYTIESLANGWLASGSEDKTIKIWDWDQQPKEMRTLRGHDGAISSLKALRSGNLASYSLDDTIRIWNPYSDANSLIRTITGHGNTSWMIPFGVLANDHLVTCSRDRSSIRECILRVWDPLDGRLVQSMKTGFLDISAMLVLSSGEIALSFIDGAIKIVDLASTDAARSQRTNLNAHAVGRIALAQLSSDLMVSFGCCRCRGLFVFTERIKIWNLADLSLFRTLETKHKDPISSICISPSKEVLASGSMNQTIRIWNLVSQ